MSRQYRQPKVFRKKELLQLIASIESFSNHPIAKAIVKYAEEQSISLNSSLKITEFAGYGIKAVTNGKEVYVGNARLLSKIRHLFSL